MWQSKWQNTCHIPSFTNDSQPIHFSPCLFLRKHTATSCCHDGAQRWETFKDSSTSGLFSSPSVSLCPSSINLYCSECPLSLFICVLESMRVCPCVCICPAKLSTTRHLSQITMQIPEGKRLMHEWRGYVYGFLPEQKRDWARKQFSSSPLLNTLTKNIRAYLITGD